ncbi:MAG: ATP-dependent DNA helicase RecG [Candidatus Liptonbacteria bacterium]|nr:ATP-dependent DNA helicase RecG [Candidatus Liptonbacteria bacterium]
MAVSLDTPLSELAYVPKRFVGLLTRMGLRTVRDLLFHFPVRYEDFSETKLIAELDAGERATVQGTVEDIHARQSWRKRFMIIEASIADATGSLRAVWFNQPYITQQLKRGASYNFSGKVSANEEGELYLSNPAFELLPHGRVGGSESDLPFTNYHLPITSFRHTGRLVPIYPETRGLTSKGLRFLVFPLLHSIELLPEFLPQNVLLKENLPEVNEALRDIHFPRTHEDAARAKRRFSFENLFLLQLSNLRMRMELQKESARPIPVSIERLKELAAALPFPLTPSQKKSLWEICQDIAEPHPMNRLLQGDVGSGKTVIAALAAILAAEAGLQTAVMAPTEILARQHYATFKKIASSVERRVASEKCPSLTTHHSSIALLTASESLLTTHKGEVALSKKKLKDTVARGEASIIIGTHALLSENVMWQNLGLVVIDEQHRFGVKQRAKLVHGSKTLPHLLSMSATPIPRTLTLTVFGDLDLSTITELPPGRKPVKTHVVPPEKRTGAYQFIRKHIKEGRQAFVICPRIQPTPIDADATQMNAGGNYPRKSAFLNPRESASEVKTVTEEHEKLSTKIFPDLRVGMLHGKIKVKEKDAVMRRFRDGEMDILVSTTVVEVGVDIPNATIMLIEGADRFGLAQLYQLRGRVGRGAHESFCFLFTDSASKSTAARLKAIVAAKNGFELAEYDLKHRGPGEFLGTTQTGFPDSAMEALMDPPLISASREAAKELLRADPALAKHPLLKQKLEEFEHALHLE